MINTKKVYNQNIKKIRHGRYFFIECPVDELESKNEKCRHIYLPLGELRQGDIRGVLRGNSEDAPDHFCVKKFLT